ncbi:MAG TPA: formylglycine-generating enzyme family protein [Terriglobia bacterium]|nr:formylglycine-generating enzyme family protein [Terriglobia bacterium]
MKQIQRELHRTALQPAGPRIESQEPPFVLIPAGSYLMGCEQGQDEEKPVHRVWVNAFEMAVYQVRNRDFAAFLAATGHPPPPEWNNPSFNDPDQPVVAVSWFEAVKFCQWLSSLTGRRCRLPTEAEWERAARAGREGLLYPWGDEPPPSRSEYHRRWGGEVKGPRRVGEEAPNALGVHDLCENVHEWCADWFDRDYYSHSPERNPQGPPTGERRASRGGSWRHHVKVSRCAARSSIPPAFQYADYGFRMVRDIP